MNRYSHMSPEHFNKAYENGETENGLVIDVREPFEWDYYHLERSLHIPLQTLPAKIGELPEERTIYVICAHGVRSEWACRFLTDQGFENVVNVAGGMAAVAAERGFAYD